MPERATIAPSVFEAARASTYSAGDVIFSQGDAADAVFYLHDGEVEIVVTSAQGQAGVVAIIKKGAFFGEECLAGSTKRPATAAALSDCRVTIIPKPDMERALHAEPAFARVFMQHLLTRMSELELALVDQKVHPAEKRLARALLLLAEFDKYGAPQPITAKVTHETLAAMVGTTRSRISHFMSKFRSLGFIDYNGRLRVHTSLLTALLRD